mgnify:CR=1 FL=1
MIEQLKVFDRNILAVEIIENYTEEDLLFFKKLFEQKLEKGFTHINILIKLDELKIDKINIKTFFSDVLWTLRKFSSLGHIAVVAHSNITKMLVTLDALFFKRASEGRNERYFDISQIDEAYRFIEED